MQIETIIQKIKNYSRGIEADGMPINEEKTRDKVLYGSTDKECTGIVTTCFASVDVIRKAHELGANLIICHEALFWNHGDHTDWLEAQNNSVYLRKKELLDQYDITVWRDHDYIHSGIPDGKGGWYDGIFKGLLHYADLDEFYYPQIGSPVQYSVPIILKMDHIPVKEIAQRLINGIGLNGIRCIGDMDTEVSTAMIPMHIMFNDNEKITAIEQKKVDLLITMELIDYTVNEYMRDGMMLGDAKAILAVGHFNIEEFGMKYMLKWLPDALQETVPSWFVQSGDMNRFILK